MNTKREDYPANVQRFFWKEFRKAANAYAEFRSNATDSGRSSADPVVETKTKGK